MAVHMQGFAIQKLYQDGKVSKKGIFGNYDGKEAQFVAVDNGKMETGSLSNQDIAALLSLRASPHSLVERLEHDLERGHRRHRHTRRHRRSRRSRSHHTRSHHPQKHHAKHQHMRRHHKKKHTRHRSKHHSRRRHKKLHRTKRL